MIDGNTRLLAHAFEVFACNVCNTCIKTEVVLSHDKTEGYGRKPAQATRAR